MTDDRRSGRPTGERPVEGLDRLRVPPPPDLEEDVVDALAARGWIRSPGRYVPPVGRRQSGVGWRWIVAAAAAVAIFVVGTMLGGGGGGPAPEGPRFLVLLYEGPEFDAPVTSEDYAEVVREYVAWSDSVRAAGFGLTGDELATEGGTLSVGPDGVEVGDVRVEGRDPDNPADPPGPDVLAGFHVLAAPSLEVAIDLARTHPHLRRGGRVVVRPIVDR